jgi:hypothetical protein
MFRESLSSRGTRLVPGTIPHFLSVSSPLVALLILMIVALVADRSDRIVPR